ncbi:MAG TPA: glycoside hydrolase family 3 N-terminal domain-containing protein, partial [Bacillota bacterium]|nr:glycoside hydrolase family 3 N-terminal domain-containing protein [Bacillota bacterium]
DAGVPAVMVAHILMPALTGSSELPASLSPQAIRYLREEMGFDGLIVSDSMSMGAITNNRGLEEASVTAFQAGIDIILFGPWTDVEPGDRKRIFTALKEAVENGAITQERLDQSVRRILTAKMEHGIIDDPWPRRENLDELVSPEHRETARRIARESITLVRDSGALIPLPVQEGVPLIWPAEKEKALAPLLETCPFLEPHLLPLGAPAAEVEKLVESVRSFTPVLVGTYDLRRYPAWSGMVNELAAVTEVAVLAMASPYDLLEVPRAAAYLAAYNDGSDSVQALGEILRGTLAPQGRLPVELPGY